MERPSIAMIPSAYKDGIVYSVLPINGAADLTFARATSATSFNATRVESDNEIQDVASNTPRLDYSGSGCPSLLLEPESTNLITYSEDFSNAYWTKRGLTTATNDLISPTGDLSAYTLTIGKIGVNDIFKYGISSIEGNVYSVSFSLKNIDSSTETITIANSQSGTDYGHLEIDLSLISSTKWERITSNHPSVNVINEFVSQSTAIGVHCALNTSSNTHLINIGVFGVQLELLPYATSYIPTSGAIETRAVETLYKSGLSDYINSSEGVLYAEVKGLGSNSDFKVITMTEGGDVSKRISLGFKGGDAVFYYSDLTSNELILYSADVLSYNKLAIKYDSQTVKFFLNGELINTDTKQLDIAFDTIELDAGNTNTEIFYGNIKDLRVYTTALTDEELTQLTS